MPFRLGLVGEHISSSLSPILFSWAFQHSDTSGSYTLFDFPRRIARSFFTNARVDWDGLNVTAPHKDLAYSLCDELSETARTARAVNTLVRKQSKLLGYNTDVAGFRFALEKKLEQVDRVERVLVIGTGGAARACLIGLAQLAHPSEICISSRKPAEALVKLDGALPSNMYATFLTTSKARRRLPDFDLVVQATPIGHAARPGFAMEPPLTFKRGALVFDLIYSPRKTLFMEAADAFDCQTENGLVMLLAQAARELSNLDWQTIPARACATRTSSGTSQIMIRFLTAGESHGPFLTGILEGMPAGLEISEDEIARDLARRQLGHGRGDRMKIEQDCARILSGVRYGKTLGSPITLQIENRDWQNWTDKMSIADPGEAARIPRLTNPRPGHADLAGSIKYHQNDIRNIIERSSARETAMRVALGAICRKFLCEFGIEIHAHVVNIGGVTAPAAPINEGADFWKCVEESPVRCADPAAEKKMMEVIDRAIESKDTVGGIFRGCRNWNASRSWKLCSLRQKT